jgi:hypothetical protein
VGSPGFFFLSQSGRGKRMCKGSEAGTHQVAITGERAMSEVM